MQHIRIELPGPGPGPGPGGNGGPGLVARILLSIVAVVMLVSAAFLGAIFFLAALGFFVIGALVLGVRIWWARRQFEQAMNRGEQPSPGRPGPRGPGDVIEGEYRVMDEGGAGRDRERKRERERERERERGRSNGGEH
jgi:predicted lipid-binding transport protein (Tim44 family)